MPNSSPLGWNGQAPLVRASTQRCTECTEPQRFTEPRIISPLSANLCVSALKTTGRRNHRVTLGRQWDGPGTLARLRIPRVYRPWDGGTADLPQDTSAPLVLVLRPRPRPRFRTRIEFAGRSRTTGPRTTSQLSRHLRINSTSVFGAYGLGRRLVPSRKESCTPAVPGLYPVV